MLSPGKFHARVPKNLRENLEFRRWILLKADRDPEYRAAIREACKQDILFYINTFIWQHNPKKKANEVGPFIAWPMQERALVSRDPERPGILWCIDHAEDLVIEKSRDMGASWLCLIAFEWLWHFHRDKTFIVISRNEDVVDKPGWPSCLFWKLDHIHRHLPDWLMPKGWEQKKHRMHLQFVNPETASVITGEASTGKAGVGGRATAMFIDEFSQIKEDREILQRTADTTDVRIFNGTHVGTGTQLYKLTTKPSIKKLVLHWTEHPEKGAGAYHYDSETARIVPHDKAYRYATDFDFNQTGKPSGGPYPGVRSPWYDFECERRGSERDIAMDLDIDPKGSVLQYFDSPQINTLKRTVGCDPYWRGELKYDRDTVKPEYLYPTGDGCLALWVNPVMRAGKLACPPGRYGCGADISQGTGATPSCFTATNADTGVKILEFVTARLKPDEFAAYCVSLCRLLRDKDGEPALFGWEAGGAVGDQFTKAVIDIGYKKVYYRVDEFDTEAEASTKPGWFPNGKSKLVLLSDYRAAIFTREMENRSLAALDETLLFKYNDRGELVHSEEASKDDPSGARTNHADRVIADALSWKMVGCLGGRIAPGKPPPEEPEVLSLAWRRQMHDRKSRAGRSWI